MGPALYETSLPTTFGPLACTAHATGSMASLKFDKKKKIRSAGENVPEVQLRRPVVERALAHIMSLAEAEPGSDTRCMRRQF